MVDEPVSQTSPDQPKPKPEKTKEEKYKAGLKLAIGVIALMMIVLAITIITTRTSTVYKSGYVNGWNDCRAKTIELLQNYSLNGPVIPYMPIINSTQNVTNSSDAQIQIVVE
jgi:hypothetical protein